MTVGAGVQSSRLYKAGTQALTSLAVPQVLAPPGGLAKWPFQSPISPTRTSAQALRPGDASASRSRPAPSVAELLMLELAAAEGANLEGGLWSWTGLRALLERLGAPHSLRIRGAVLRQLACEVLVEVGARPRPDGPLVSWSFKTHMRVMHHPEGRFRRWRYRIRVPA
jgi:hypothetical protein